MANEVTGVSLNDIYEQLNDTTGYHPFNANTFMDWSLEAGDRVSMIRDGDAYSSPVHTSRLVWKGTPTLQLNSTGNEKRDAVSRVSRKKYGRGSAGIRSQEGIHREFYSEDGVLHSELHITESYLRTEFHDETNSLRSYFDMTASHMRTEFLDEVHSLRGEFEVTASHLRTEFEDDVNSLRGEFEVTTSHLRTEFEDDVNSLRGEFEVTASHLRTEFEDDVNSLRGEFEITTSHLRTEFDDDINSLRGEFEVTVSHLRTEFTDEVHSLRGEFEVTASHLRTEFEDDVNSVRSYMHQTASSWEARVEGVTDANGNITAASIALAVNSAGSEARINANRIYLLGQTIADTIDANYISTKVAEIPHLYTNHITMDGNLTLGGRLVLLGVNVTSLVSSVKSVRISGPTNNTYKLQYTTYDDDSWQDAGTFSRATTLSGAWSGRRFTVTASPQGNIKTGTVYETIVPDTSDSVAYNANTKQLSRLYYVYSEDENGDADSVILHKTVSIPGDLAYAAGFTDGSASGGSTSLTATWAGGKITVTASPQGATLERLLQAGAVTWSGTRATIPISSVYGSSGQYSDGVVFTPFVDVSSKLQTKTISENGTVNPDAGYIGFGSVTVAVPTTNASARFGAGEGSYFIEAYDRISGTSITGSSVTYKLAKSGNKIQIQNTSSVQLSNTPEYDMSTDLTNAGYSGRAAVTLNDPTWNPVTGATPDYRTVTVTTVGRTNASGIADQLSKSVSLYLTQGSWSSNQLTVSMRAGRTSGTVYASTTVDASTLVTSAGYSGRAAVTLDEPTWNAVTGATPDYRTVTVTTVGRTNASGIADQLSKSVSLYLTQGSWSSNQLTVSMRAGRTSGTVYASTTVDASTLVSNATTAGYKAGWEAYYTKWHYPDVGTSAGMTVYWPEKTVDSAFDSISRTYTIQNKDNNTVYLRYNSKTYAEYAHNKYDAGWGEARGKLSVPISQATAQTLVIKFPASTVGGQTSQTYYVTEDNTYAYIRAGASNGTVVARVSNSAYGNGWTNAYNQIVFPSNNTSSASMTLKTTSSAVDGTAATTTYNLVVDNNVAYIKDGNNVKAQVTHNKYNDGYNANTSGWIAYDKDGATSNQGYLAVGRYIHAYTNNINGVARNSGGYWWIPSAWFRYVSGAGSNHQGDLASDSYIELIYTKSDASGDVRGTGSTWHVPASGGGSHSISVSRQWTAGGSGYDTGSKLNGGGFSIKGLKARTYYYITVSCGDKSKQIYFVCND